MVPDLDSAGAGSAGSGSVLGAAGGGGSVELDVVEEGWKTAEKHFCRAAWRSGCLARSS